MDNTHEENITQASSFPKQSTAYFPAIDSLKNCLFFFLTDRSLFYTAVITMIDGLTRDSTCMSMSRCGRLPHLGMGGLGYQM